MSDLHTRVSKAFRVGSDSLRRVYTTGRKAGRFFRDAAGRTTAHENASSSELIDHLASGELLDRRMSAQPPSGAMA